jgi:L-ascorbate metabolism protein UlaG (beta-lactamase superfamily)
MKSRLRWLGVAFVELIIGDDDRVILFDPWTKTDGSPSCPLETADIHRADLVLVSHDHFDHVASAAAICKRTGALLGGPDETMKRIMKAEGLPASQVVNNGAGYIVGGGTVLPWVKVISTPAHHTSNTSAPVGTIVRAHDGLTVYHAGDTSLTGEMELYARLYPLDVALLPIYGIATMDALQATEAARLMKPRKVMPIHFDFCASPEAVLAEFLDLCRARVPEVEVIRPILGEYVEL